MKHQTILIVIITILYYLFGSNGIADTLVVKNGDTLTGKLIGLSGRVVTFKTDYAGTLFIKVDKVEVVATDAVFTIIFSDGSQQTSALNSDLDIEKIDIIRSAGTTPLIFNTDWKRQLTISLDGANGNNQSQNFSMYGESSLLRSKTEHVLNVAQTWERTDEITTTNVLDVKYNFRWLRESRWYNTLNIDYAYDPSKDITWRSVLGFGGGKKFIDHSLSDLSIDLATSVVYQSLDDIEEVLPALRVASTYHKKLFGGRVQFLQQNRLLWITEASKGVYDGVFGIRLLLSNSLNLDFRSNVKYETEPAENNQKADLTYSFGIGSSF